jgi:arabinogalactan oligomer/maltooligosaccharide transport system permease protein
MINKHFNSRKLKTGIANTALYIVLALMSIVWLFPFVYLIVTSFRGETTGISGNFFPQEWSLVNYKYLFTDPQSRFLNWYINTLIIALVVSVVNTMITLLTAYALSRMRFNGRKALMKFMLVLGMFPGFLGMICIYYLLDALGLVGNSSAIYGLMLVYVSGSMMGYYVSKGFFDTIPKSLDEAAMIDGASKSKIFFSITLPLSKPIIIQTLLGAFVAPWGDFMMANYLVGRTGEDYMTVAVGLRQWVDGQIQYQRHFTHFCAGGVIVSIIPIILFFVMQRFYVEGVTGGSVKG